MDAALESRLRELLHKREIHELLMRYCRGINRADRELIASCFHPDALDDHGTFTLSGPTIAEKLHAILNPPANEDTPSAGAFFIGNELVEIEGNVAWAETYWISYGEQKRGGSGYLRARCARFLDRLERRDGQWRIAYRVVADEWSRVDAIVERSPDARGLRRGLRSKRDAVYAIRGGMLPRVEADPLVDVGT